eukprot:SAG22_NODE_1351_length_4647_cov_2.223835_2_plen_51_part_00
MTAVTAPVAKGRPLAPPSGRRDCRQAMKHGCSCRASRGRRRRPKPVPQRG